MRSVMAARADLLAASLVPDELAVLAHRKVAAAAAAKRRTVIFWPNRVGFGAGVRHSRYDAALLVDVAVAVRLDVALRAILGAKHIMIGELTVGELFF